ncbi:MAG: GTP cyclohydrolase II RibA [Proteobacteria bacterium]|nr:GTP cyclohydrolase II RibA [Pseudomonadota bacterium]
MNKVVPVSQVRSVNKVSSILALFDAPEARDVERALAEFRAGRPVVLLSDDRALLVLHVEALGQRIVEGLASFAPGQARLVLPAARLRRMGLKGRQQAGVLAFPTPDAARVQALAFGTRLKVDAPVAPASALDEAALELARLALLAPAIYALPLDTSLLTPDLIQIEAEAVAAYRAQRAVKLELTARAPVPLEFARECEFVVFRGGEGLKDQVAVIVGKPDPAKPVAIRLHSACLTGDLFGALHSDAGDQLRASVKAMAEGDGGVLLYLDQEGRGNGIANSLRAYRLQGQGWDTYDSDEVLGFGQDQRRFDFAAEMLRQLGYTHVRVMTGNPLKLKALEAAGLEVSREAVAEAHAVTDKPGERAGQKTGHVIELDAMVAHAPPRD